MSKNRRLPRIRFSDTHPKKQAEYLLAHDRYYDAIKACYGIKGEAERSLMMRTIAKKRDEVESFLLNGRSMPAFGGTEKQNAWCENIFLDTLLWLRAWRHWALNADIRHGRVSSDFRRQNMLELADIFELENALAWIEVVDVLIPMTVHGPYTFKEHPDRSDVPGEIDVSLYAHHEELAFESISGFLKARESVFLYGHPYGFKKYYLISIDIKA